MVNNIQKPHNKELAIKPKIALQHPNLYSDTWIHPTALLVSLTKMNQNVEASLRYMLQYWAHSTTQHLYDINTCPIRWRDSGYQTVEYKIQIGLTTPRDSV